MQSKDEHKILECKNQMRFILKKTIKLYNGLINKYKNLKKILYSGYLVIICF